MLNKGNIEGTKSFENLCLIFVHIYVCLVLYLCLG